MSETILQPTEFLAFVPLPSPIHKRPAWEVISRKHGDDMGRIAFFPRWRQHIFEPFMGTVYNKGCLRDLAERLDQVNREQRQRRRESA